MKALEDLKNARKKIVGIKQTLKALEKGGLRVVFIASDAEDRVVKPLVQQCIEQSITVIYVDSMSILGKACGIEVGSAAAGLPVE